jgi:hypothetical protein
MVGTHRVLIGYQHHPHPPIPCRGRKSFPIGAALRICAPLKRWDHDVLSSAYLLALGKISRPDNDPRLFAKREVLSANYGVARLVSGRRNRAAEILGHIRFTAPQVSNRLLTLYEIEARDEPQNRAPKEGSLGRIASKRALPK